MQMNENIYTKYYKIPNEIVIQLINECNLKCDFCFDKKRKKSELKTEDVKKIIDDIKTSKIDSVRFSGGEPFLRKDLYKILKYAKQKKLYIILNTNGTLINKKNIKYFSKVDQVVFSFHSLKMYSRIKKNIGLLKNNNINITIATILNEINIKNLEKFYKVIKVLKKEHNFDWILLRDIKQSPIFLRKIIKKLTKKIKENNYRYNLKTKISNGVPFCLDKEISEISKGGVFDSGYSRLYIDSLGSYKTDYVSNKKLGYIGKNKILDIWNSRYMKDIRNYKKIDRICIKCNFLKKCRGGIISIDLEIN